VYDRDKSCTLAFALDATGTSLAAVADAAGVSKSRAAAWTNGDAEPHLGHVRRMPASVRRALGEALVASASAKVLPIPLAMYEHAALGVLSKVSALTLRVETLRESGDIKARNAALREISDLRAALDRIEAGVRLAAVKGAR
jgi:transcriptional regulator with XRE-family HTH domain